MSENVYYESVYFPGEGGGAALVSAITANENHWLLLVKMIYHGWSKHHPQKATGLINT